MDEGRFASVVIGKLISENVNFFDIEASERCLQKCAMANKCLSVYRKMRYEYEQCTLNGIPANIINFNSDIATIACGTKRAYCTWRRVAYIVTNLNSAFATLEA